MGSALETTSLKATAVRRRVKDSCRRFCVRSLFTANVHITSELISICWTQKHITDTQLVRKCWTEKHITDTQLVRKCWTQKHITDTQLVRKC